MISRTVARAPSFAPGYEQRTTLAPALPTAGRPLAGTWAKPAAPLLRFLLVLLFAFGLMCIYLSQLSTITDITYQLGEIKATATVLEHANAQLAREVAVQNAPSEIEQAARARGMGPVATPVFLAAPDSAAPAGPDEVSSLGQRTLP